MASAMVHFPVSATVVTIGLLPNMPAQFSTRSFLVSTLVMAFGFLLDIDHISSLRPGKIRNGMWIRELEHTNWMHTWQAATAVALVSVKIWNIMPLISYVLHILIDAPNLNNMRCPLPLALLCYVPVRLRYIYKFRNKQQERKKAETS